MSAFISPTAAREVAIATFNSTYTASCSCPRLELRSENGHLICARCDGPIMRRAVVGVCEVRR